jgi:hypothetical protein
MQLAKSAWPNINVQLLERLLGHKLNITPEIVKTRVAEAITAERRRGRAVRTSAGGRRDPALRFDDVFALKEVGDPRLSPDGACVAYTVRTMDAKADEAYVDVYAAPSGGGDALRVTTSKKPETSPRFSPDGRYLAFLSGRDGKKGQVWLLEVAILRVTQHAIEKLRL